MQKNNPQAMHLAGKRQAGQGMVEYIIIVALIALAAIGAFSYFGQAIRGQTAQMAAQISGQGGEEGTATAQKAATGAQSEADKDVNLDNYVERDKGATGGG
ncbi:hypothetical protein [Salinisphaera sp.]|uniref:hypothetical protein n=1 Tax=Salinisphaera sp. TaxID=1914330 RepID=UPI002D79EE26|nr:hypothetical protein [Salinisphaera sp.]HET7313105.1 hypothetical protein [Salinisphaera sp.]